MASLWKNELSSRAVRLGNGHVDAELALVLDAHDAVENGVSIRQVLEVVEKLPEAQRLAVVLVYVEGYSYAEAAQFLAIPVGTLMSRLAAGKSAISLKLGTRLPRGTEAWEFGE
jgi:RNA polymerase sigma-70 factor (ECF subfamily)